MGQIVCGSNASGGKMCLFIRASHVSLDESVWVLFLCIYFARSQLHALVGYLVLLSLCTKGIRVLRAATATETNACPKRNDQAAAAAEQVMEISFYSKRSEQTP